MKRDRSCALTVPRSSGCTALENWARSTAICTRAPGILANAWPSAVFPGGTPPLRCPRNRGSVTHVGGPPIPKRLLPGYSSPRRASLRTDYGTLEPPPAPLLIEFGGLVQGDRVLDVGCGTGNLSFALPEAANASAVTGSTRPRCSSRLRASAATTRASAFNTLMRRHYRSPMARSTAPFRCSCCHSLPISSMLSLRCAAWSGPAGQVTAAVWDQFGGMPVFPLLRDTAAALARTAERPRALFSSLTAPGEMSA